MAGQALPPLDRRTVDQSLERYEQQLAQQTQQPRGQAEASAGQAADPTSSLPAAADRIQSMPSPVPALRGDASGPAPPPAAPSATNLASLELTLPERGVPIYFTGARGETTITARVVDRRLITHLADLAWVAATLLLAIGLWRIVARHGAAVFAHRPVATILLILGAALWLGMLSAIAGGLLLVAALLLMARRELNVSTAVTNEK